MASLKKNTPFWKTEAFIILALLLFSPLGVFLMWKYSPWRKRSKILLSIFFLIGLIPAVFFGILALYLFVFNTAGSINNAKNPEKANYSASYTCQPINAEWGKCTSNTYGLSFEYPVAWYYTDVNLLSNKQTIGFSPLKENIRDSYLISLNAGNNEDKQPGDSDRFYQRLVGMGDTPLEVNGHKAVKSTNLSTGPLFTLFTDNLSAQFWFNTTAFKERTYPVTEKETEIIFDHMTQSFRFEK